MLGLASPAHACEPRAASTTVSEFVATESEPEYQKPVEGSGKDRLSGHIRG